MINPLITLSQNLSDRTNDLHLSFTAQGLTNSIQIPVVEWLHPQDEYTSSQENVVSVKATVHSLHPLSEIRITIGDAGNNNITATKVLKIEQDVRDYIIEKKVYLPSTSNILEIVATDNRGATVSSSRSIVVGNSPFSNLLAIDRKDYALFFLTDKYDHWDDLVNPIDDGNTIAAKLKDRYGFEVEIVENPTAEKVWEKLHDYNERKFKPQDQLLIFFAGHGHFDEGFGEGYVVAKNSLKKDPSKNTYISHNRLRGIVNNIPSEHILLMMDVCFGGTLDPLVTRSRNVADSINANEMLARKLKYKTRKYLTSGGKEYVSDGIPGKHSPFAGKLIEALSTLGGDDRMLTLSELQTYLEKLQQLPRLGSFGEDNQLSDFVFVQRKKE